MLLMMVCVLGRRFLRGSGGGLREILDDDIVVDPLWSLEGQHLFLHGLHLAR